MDHSMTARILTVEELHHRWSHPRTNEESSGHTLTLLQPTQSLGGTGTSFLDSIDVRFRRVGGLALFRRLDLFTGPGFSYNHVLVVEVDCVVQWRSMNYCSREAMKVRRSTP